MRKQPNILLAIADDASHFSPYGHSFVKTPACDFAAENGVLFENAFTPNPKCAPSRASILTGRYPWQLKDACNHQCYFPPDFPVFPALLENSGYHTGFTGKGWAPGDFQRAGFTHNPAGHEYNLRKLTPPEGSKISDCDYTENFRDFLAARPDGAPFYFWYGCREPHRAYNFGEGLLHGKTLDEIESVPPYWPDGEDTRTDILDYAFEIEWFDRHLGQIIELLRQTGELENTLILIMSDNGCPFPRIKGQMYEQDFHLPMLAVWPEKIAPGRRITDIVSFADIAPTFLEAAGIAIPDDVTGSSFLGLLSSEKSGRIDPKREFTCFGREKHDVGREGDVGYPVRCIRDYKYLYIRNYAPERWPVGNPETGYTNCDSSPVKTKILRLNAQGERYYHDLCFGKRPAEELYDIVSDPECMKNLANLPEHAALCRQYRDKLHAFLLETGDSRMLGDADVFDRYPHSHVGLHSWANYIAGKYKPQAY